MKIDFLKITAYFFTIAFAALILFPLAFMASSAVKDDISVYEMPPKLIPESSKSVTYIVDYTDVDNAELEEALIRDCVAAMFGTVYEFNKSAIGEVIFYGKSGDKTIFHSRAHRQLLRLELDFGLYNGVSLDANTITFKDKHRDVMKNIGYTFDISGIALIAPSSEDNSLDFASLLRDKYTLAGEYQGSVVKEKMSLMLENFKYYLLMPSYVYSEHDSIRTFGFLAFFFNTVLGLAVALVTQVGLCALTAYALSKLFRPQVSKWLLMVFLATLMIPFISIFVPLLTTLQSFGIKGGYLGMFLVHLYPDAFFIVIYKGFFDQLPKSLFEAAKIDGASPGYVFTRICLPLSTPIISVIALNTFVKEWGSFFWYFAVTNNTPKYWTINLAIYQLSINPTMKANVTMGIAVVMALPIILLTIIFSKKIKESVAMSGIKG